MQKTLSVTISTKCLVKAIPMMQRVPGTAKHLSRQMIFAKEEWTCSWMDSIQPEAKMGTIFCPYFNVQDFLIQLLRTLEAQKYILTKFCVIRNDLCHYIIPVPKFASYCSSGVGD